MVWDSVDNKYMCSELGHHTLNLRGPLAYVQTSIRFEELIAYMKKIHLIQAQSMHSSWPVPNLTPLQVACSSQDPSDSGEQ